MHRAISPARATSPIIDGPSKFKKKANATVSTWQVSAAGHRDFHSEAKGKFIAADDDSYMKAWSYENISKELDLHRGALGKEAMNRFNIMAEKKYGSIRNMMRSFQKQEEDVMTLDEFSNNLHRRNLDQYLSRDDQRLIFELFDKKHKGSIKVGALLEGAKESSEHHVTPTIPGLDIDEIRAKIGFQLLAKREAMKVVDSARSQERQMKRDLRNLDPDSTGFISKEMFSDAFSQKYLGLEVSEKEKEKIFSELCEIRHSKPCISYDNFARFLKIVDINLDTIPFFDAKGAEVSGLKHRINVLEQTANEPIRMQRIIQLKKQHIDRKIALDERDKRLVASPRHRQEPDEQQRREYFEMPHTSSASRSVSRSRSQTASVLSQSDPSLSLSRSNKKKSVSRASSSSGHLPPLSASPASTLSPSHSWHALIQSPLNSSQQEDSEGRGERESERDDFDTLPGAVFSATYSPAAMTRYADPTLVITASAVQPDPSGLKSGKKYYPSEITDWSRVGYGSNKPRCGPSLSGMELENDMRYRTTTGSYFSDLNYELNGSIQRDGLSDAERDRLKRQQRFESRLARTRHNQEITKSRVELEELLKSLTHERRAQNIARKSLRYTSQMYLDDLKGFEKMPPNHMQKKPNPQQHQKVWGDHQTDHNLMDDRDFLTTTQQSFALASIDSPANSKEI
mmetsp:Transcript_28588/g.28921  ORF Transcript_28588/g.28921 Transcript_28588/m.28921 type:complete len:683 (-) Transcript_28588:159-2207(-)|eukprot:CAMPEP_0182425622 /NCGR_PEP_ID=MMETSP1167-20130531/12091_1 /TAXON_ID=2988 /ORGANISM="Mallomonas Sp, Strain CCMP3275" /LENGTH=682 /DNA_ID=CAMNT_0024606497 /DNA_START=54 /DNA_END=2102 /DNA_ORIENTATION=+